MEIYDFPFVENSNGNLVPLATFFDPEEFEFTPFAPLTETSPGAVLRVENAAINEGLSFKIRAAGWMIKDLGSGKVARAPVENELLAMLMDTGNNAVVSNIDDPNCGFPTDVIAENIFTNCFEFTIGGKDQLYVEAAPDSIYPGESSVLTARLITAQGDTVSFPPDQVLEVSIDEEFRNVGTLLSATNDTADVITNIGPVFGFLSNAPVGAPQSVSITLITAYEGEVLRVSKELGLRAPFDLAIVLDGDAEVQPTLRAGNGTNNVEDFFVTVLENGIGIPNHEVEITLRFIPATGGHDHVAPPELLLLGRLDNRDTDDFGIGQFTTQTNQEGVIRIRYTATEIGGELEIKARSTTQFNEVLDSLDVRVPNLEYLGTSTFYELVGAPNNNSSTNDPCRIIAPASEHNSNHWGSENLIQLIRETSTSFDSLHPGYVLRINDLSIENGGIFDFNNNWSPPHNSHRMGINADIGFSVISPSGQCVPNPNRRDLRRILVRSSSQFPLIEGNHYHIIHN